jgi:hypothetical protein
MATLSENTPIYSTRKTAAEAEQEMKEETKKEMEKLKDLMKSHVASTESTKTYEEELFLEDSDDTSIESEESEETKDILKKISKSIINNDSLKRKNKSKKSVIKSIDSKYGVVDSAVKVERLKSEISKLESRIRYKDLDMANLMVTQNELNVVVNKIKLFEEILNDLQIKEVKVNDLRNTLKTIIGLNSNKIIFHQLVQLEPIYESLNIEINNPLIDEKLTKINNHNFARLILTKRDYILTDLNNLKDHNNYIKKDIQTRKYILDIIKKTLLILALIGGIVFLLYVYLS